MKKAFIQKLSIAMASALVITAATPASADAAVAMTMNRTAKTLYLNSDNMTNTADTYDFNIKNKPAKYKTKYKFTWYAENDSIVDVAKGGVVTAKKVGKTTIKCDITKKSTGKVVDTLEATVEVKANAETVVINNAPDNGEIAVGTTFDFNRTMTAANGGKATDKTEWIVSADKEGTEATDVATVDKMGVVTALKAGTFYVTAKTYQSAATKDLGATATSEAVEVKVPLQMTDIKLTKADTIELTFDSSVADTVKTAADVKIQTVATNKVNIPVKSVSVSEDGKTVTVVSYASLTNGTTYSFTAAGSTKEFTAKIGTISSIVINNYTVAKISADSEATNLVYSVYDENGVDVTANYPLSQMAVSSSSTNASMVDGAGKVKMYNEGDVVSVQLTYTKWNNTTNTLDTIKSNVATITCISKSAQSTSAWTINGSGDFSKTITSINVGDAGKFLNVKMKNNFNQDITSGFSFTSLDESKLLVDKHTGALTALATGTVAVKVEYGSYVDYITVTVNAKPSLATVEVSAQSLSLSNKISDAVGVVTQESQTVTFTLKDNYGNVYTAGDKSGTFKVGSASNAVSASYSDGDKVAFTDGKATVTFTAVSGQTGTGYYYVQVNGVNYPVSVTTKTPGGVSDYTVSLSKTTADSYKSELVTMTLYGVDSTGTKAATSITGTAITYAVKNASGETKLNGTLSSATNTVDLATAGLADGTYNVYVNIGPITKTATFTVKSTKVAASYTQNKATISNVGEGTNIASKVAEAFTVKVGSTTIAADQLTYHVKNTNVAAVSGDVIQWNNETSVGIYVEKVTFYYTDSNNITSSYSINIGTTVTFTKN